MVSRNVSNPLDTMAQTPTSLQLYPGGERLKVLQKMLAHTQFCWPGDNTIEASGCFLQVDLPNWVNLTLRLPTWPLTTSLGLKKTSVAGVQSAQVLPVEVLNAMEKDSCDSRGFVVVVSDANFRRYRMDPLWWSEALKRDSRVDGHADTWQKQHEISRGCFVGQSNPDIY